MSELELRFPSDQPYAYFAVRGTPEEIQALDFEMLATLYVNTQFAVLKGTTAAKDAILGAKMAPIPEGSLEATEREHIKEVREDSERRIKEYAAKPEPEAPPGDPDAAAQRLAEGRRPRTVPEAEEMERQALTALSEGLDGATEIEDVNAPPWNKPAPKGKTPAWEKPKPKPEVDVSSDDFDF